MKITSNHLQKQFARVGRTFSKRKTTKNHEKLNAAEYTPQYLKNSF